MRSRLRILHRGQCFCNRTYVSKADAAATKSYAKSLRLPKTDFPLRGDAVNREPLFRKRTTEDLYAWQGSNNSGEAFILHDGPPYANGSLHIGHGLNKIPKDIINRYKILQGRRIIYIPGWDCHGLPIELKALSEAKGKVNAMSPIEIRTAARRLAEKVSKEQSVDFQSYGILGDWKNPYKTMDLEYELNQLKIFHQMVKKGLIYRRHKPVYWSPSSRTALAESELEYNDQHKSTSVYVTLPITHPSEDLKAVLEGMNIKECHLAVWTTTPWTLPANRAVAIHNNLEYAICKSNDIHFIIALDRLEPLREVLGEDIQLVKTLLGQSLIGVSYRNPLRSSSSETFPVLHGDHVSAESGTGLVHSAPGHGHEDYDLCLKVGIEAYAPVDELGRFTPAVEIPELEGLFVQSEGTEKVIKLLQQTKSLLKQQEYVHKYPYDWRTKKPVIIRATKQWFADLTMVKPAAEAAVAKLNMVPPSSRNRLESFIKGRSEWCISRQRSWGVPIPVLYDMATDEALLTDGSIEHIIGVLSRKGTDAWWSADVTEFVPESYKAREFRKGLDTMDVWFDSGTSWATLQQRLGNKECPVADVYLEGSDQHRGWFQSSMLTSIATTGLAPTKTFITHGFVLDEHGRKMSKSLGNVMEPKMILQGDKKRPKQFPAYGADVLRLWVASTEYTRDVSIGPNIMQHISESMRKIRNTARFMLGNLNGYAGPVAYSDLGLFEKYILHETFEFSTSCRQHYDEYAFNRVVQNLNRFTTSTLSAFTFDVVKDNLYADATDDIQRRATLTLLCEILRVYTSVLAPIVPHLAEEIYEYGREFWGFANTASIFQQQWYVPPDQWRNEAAAETIKPYIALTDVVKRLLEQARGDKRIGNSLQADVYVDGSVNIDTALLKRLCITSNVKVGVPPNGVSFSYEETADDVRVQVVDAQRHKCPRCWIYQSAMEDHLCERCERVLN